MTDRNLRHIAQTSNSQQCINYIYARRVGVIAGTNVWHPKKHLMIQTSDKVANRVIVLLT